MFHEFTLVLYSQSAGLWKLADFGLMSEATSKQAITTGYGRGTSCYRAPELLNLGDAQSTFTNKVDIWAMGCIIGEIMTGRRLFDSDWAVYRYYESTLPPNITAERLPTILQEHVVRMLLDLLQRDYRKRPGILLVRSLLLTSLFVVSQVELDIRKSIGPYDSWKKFLSNCTSTEEVYRFLIEYFKSQNNFKLAAA
jgi:serine/threonine protein kinase